ncbi:MAG: RluA family pseudouridine synthase, partial [Planctomycetota bacterium]
MIPLPRTVELSKAHQGKRAERVLLELVPGIKESFLLLLLHRGKVLLDGKPVARGERLPGAGKVELLPPDPRPAGPVPNTKVDLVVRHEDTDVLVVEKPSGLAMQPGPEHGTRTLQNALVARFPDLVALGPKRNYGLVSRLDVGVSGLVVVARSERAHEALVAQFTAREPEKRYRALTVGVLPGMEGKVTTPIEEREAETEWKVLNRAKAGGATVSLVLLHPLTGRKHQLRLHMAELGAPILGDKQHG